MISAWSVLDGFMAAVGTLLALRLALLVGAASFDVVRRWLRPAAPPEGEWPPITVVIPAFNEERVLAGAARSVLASDYPDLRLVLVDDGSTDRTLAVARDVAATDPRVEVLEQRPNGGKAAALNAGVAAARTDLLVTLDADTHLAPDTLRALVAPLRAGADAVSCNLKVGNRRSWLLHWQSVEYVVGLNLGRRAQATLGCITTIPGAAAAFRRAAVDAVGGWSSDTRTEDTDLSLSLLERGFRVVYEPEARAFTEAPETVSQLVRQRTRWMHGYLACLWKHRRSFLRLDVLGLFGMPNLLLLHLLAFPLFLLSLGWIWTVTRWTDPASVLQFLTGLLWADLTIALVAYLVDREQKTELLHAPVWRIGFPFLLLYVFFRTWAHVMTGRIVPWDKPHRTGHVGRP